MAKYRVSWPVEKTRDVVLEADSEEEALRRAQEPDEWSNEEISSYNESQLLCKERWKRAFVILEQDHQQAVADVEKIMAKRHARKEKRTEK